MLGRTNTGGGGSGGLNFQVIGGTTAPSNPKENMIWVNTSKKITSYIFSATQPTNPTEGLVWFFTAAPSIIQFNALKKNGIQVYPISAKQYIGGAWVAKTAKSWQGGEWVDWIPEGVLYRSDLPYTATIEATNYINSGSFSGVTPSLTDNSDYLTLEIAGSGSIGWSIFPKNAVDLSKFTKAVATIKRNNTVPNFSVLLGVTDTKKAGFSVIAEKDAQASTSQQTFELDLSSVNVNGYPFISLKRTSAVTSKCTVDLFDWHLE